MPPRFLERMQRQSDVLRDVFGDPENDPPPYPFSPSRTNSSASSFQYRRSADLSAYQNRFSQDSTPSSSIALHRRQPSSRSSVSQRYRQSGDAGLTYNFPSPPGYAQATSPARPAFDITAIPRDSLVLVTGANSYLGMHIVDQLLQYGFRVRGTVRDAEKAIWTAKYFLDRYGAGHYTTAVIPDMAAPHAFDIAVRGCAGVVHAASVTTPSADPNEVITPSIAGAINALEAAGKERGLRRVVVTSCVAAAVSHQRATRDVVGGESWNMNDFMEAWEPPPPPYVEEKGLSVGRTAAVAASSKMQMEQAAWRWYWERRPGFVLNSVLPDTLWGAPLCPQQQQLPQSVRLLSSLLPSKNSSTISAYPKSGHFTNPTDAAALHLAALLFPDVQQERVFAVSAPWTQQSIKQILAKLCPPNRMNAVESGVGWEQGEGGEEEESKDLTLFKDVERAEGLLRRIGKHGWRGLEGSLEDVVEGFGLDARSF